MNEVYVEKMLARCFFHSNKTKVLVNLETGEFYSTASICKELEHFDGIIVDKYSDLFSFVDEHNAFGYPQYKPLWVYES